LGILPQIHQNETQSLEITWEAQKHSKPKDKWRLNSSFLRFTQNLEKLEILDLPQIDRWKHRSLCVDHVSWAGLEFGGLDLLESKVLDEKPKRNHERGEGDPEMR
jgi:hypothetical protein